MVAGEWWARARGSIDRGGGEPSVWLLDRRLAVPYRANVVQDVEFRSANLGRNEGLLHVAVEVTLARAPGVRRSTE